MLVLDDSSFSSKREMPMWWKKRKEEKYTKKHIISTSTELRFFLVWPRVGDPPPKSYLRSGIYAACPRVAGNVCHHFRSGTSGPSCMTPPPPLQKLRLRLYLCQVSTLYPHSLTHSTPLVGSGRPNRRLLAPCTTLKIVCSVTYYYTILYHFTSSI